MKSFLERAEKYLKEHSILSKVYLLYDTLSEALRIYNEENIYIWKNYEFLNSLDRQIIQIQVYVDEMKYTYV